MTKLKTIIFKIINLRDTTDVRNTIDSIRNSIEIRGYNVWILACGAMLASIGITLDSTAVIIGAMLISPLMSPILGIGLSVGINDQKNLILALESFSVAVIASLLVSTLYFIIIPFESINDQITSRIEPNILDVLIAIFGGVAGIIAGSRKEKTNAIPGVAIATALMPPLCVAGYGLANYNLGIFFGAFYLFFINAVFIALSTYVIIRFLKFPYTEFMDESTRKKSVRWILIFVFLIIIPSGVFMYNFSQRFTTSQHMETFKAKARSAFENDNRNFSQFEFETGDSLNDLTIVLVGHPIPPDSVYMIDSLMKESLIENTRLHLIQNPPRLNENELASKTTLDILTQVQPSFDRLNQRIDSIQSNIRQTYADTFPVTALRKEIAQLFPEVQNFGMGKVVESSTPAKKDTIPLASIKWNPGLRSSLRRSYQKRLSDWLTVRLQLDTLKMLEER